MSAQDNPNAPQETVYLCRKAYPPHECQYFSAAYKDLDHPMSDCVWQGVDPLASKGQDGLVCTNEEAYGIARKINLPVRG